VFLEDQEPHRDVRRLDSQHWLSHELCQQNDSPHHQGGNDPQAALETRSIVYNPISPIFCKPEIGILGFAKMASIPGLGMLLLLKCCSDFDRFLLLFFLFVSFEYIQTLQVLH